MRILVACEFSGVVRDAFRRRGHEAWSCDLEDVEPLGEWPNYHLYGDCLYFIEAGIGGKPWDLLIAHPPCTYLAVSGLHWNKRLPERKKKHDEALEFVRLLLNAPIPHIALENPVGAISTHIRKPDQKIQPWQFGHPESKLTCLWLKGLPLLVPTNVLEPERMQTNGKSPRWRNQTPTGQNKLGPSAERAKIRSITYQGIADAMAEQWGQPAATQAKGLGLPATRTVLVRTEALLKGQ